MKWHHRHMAAARLVASWSKDPSTKVDARIARGKVMVSEGFNGPPQGFTDDPGMPRSLKLSVTLHAELNTILFARQPLDGCTIYVTHHPCAHCASVIAQVGITRVVCHEPAPEFVKRWAESLQIARAVFQQAGVEVLRYADL